MDKFENMMNDIFGAKQSHYTAEEIDEARKRQKKHGGTLMENLVIVSGKGMQSSIYDFEAAEHIEDTISSLMDDRKKPAASKEKDPFADLNAILQKNADDLDAQIAALNQNLKNDFGVGVGEKKSSEGTGRQTAAAPEKPVLPAATAESFRGVEDALKRVIFGQDAFLKKLTVAFKRPYVLKEEDGHAKNTIFVHGPEDTGRHAALNAMASELYVRGVLRSDKIAVIDLSLYTAAGNDNVFLQDLYSALQSKADILLFENYEACHISYLAYVSELFTTGSCRLSSRYVLQNGQLVSVPNSFASEAISSFSAADKYLVMISLKGADGLASALGAPFVNALGDIAATDKLDEESYKKISAVKWNELKQKVQTELRFILTGDEAGVQDAAVSMTGKGAGLAGMLNFYVKMLKALAGLRLENDYDMDAEAELSIRDGRVIAAVAGEETDLLDQLPGGYTGALEQVKAELENIVGLTEIKKYVYSLEEYYSVQKRRREQGLKAGEVNKHMIFTGSPGTGKTTIARIISRYLKAIGVLSGGQLVEVTRADLVGRYVGHTAPLTTQVLNSAIGGVLFIDEAYSLYRGKDDSFGLEAIDTLVKGIEDNRDNLIVILAGYSNEMAEFLTANSGLKSRFPNIIDFPNYTGEELLEIAKITAKSKGYQIDEGALAPLLKYFETVQMIRPDTAGNGRLVRNKIEDAILNQSRRVVAEPEADLSMLESRDFDLSDVNG